MAPKPKGKGKKKKDKEEKKVEGEAPVEIPEHQLPLPKHGWMRLTVSYHLKTNLIAAETLLTL